MCIYDIYIIRELILIVMFEIWLDMLDDHGLREVMVQNRGCPQITRWRGYLSEIRDQHK